MVFSSATSDLARSSSMPSRASAAMCRTSSRVTAISIVAAFEVGLRDHERLAADRLVIEIDLHFRVAAAAGQLGDRATSELAVLHARADREDRSILRLVFDGRAAERDRGAGTPRRRRRS